MVDMHKEIKLSDLFKRGPKEPGEPKAEKPPKEPKQPKEPKRKKEPKPPRRSKEPAVAAREAPPLLAVPLMRAFNLLPREEARPTKERESPLPHILVALAGVLVFAALAAFYLSSGAAVTKKKGEVEDLRAELAAYQAPQPQQSIENKTAALAQERVSRTSALGSALASRLAWDRVLREIALVVPDDVTLSSIQGSSPASASAPAPTTGVVTNLTVVGTTASQASVAEFMARLTVIPELSAVRLTTAGTTPDDTNTVAFTITGTLRSGS
jgi:Tfp pilus assembly protein PilN